MRRVLKEKVIFITGASSGIGRETALQCAREGMRVVVAARRETRLREVVDEIEAMGEQALAVRCDVGEDAPVKAAIEQTMQRFGRLDAVYANAGYGIFGQVDQTPEDAHRQIFEVNYFGTIRTINFALPHLRATRDGLKHILICSSAASEIGLPMFGPYSATKAAQDSIAGAMRAELRDQGIHVTSIHPVGTKTEFFAVAGDRSQEDALQHNAPDFFTQTAAHVARRIVAALRSPRAEVWPSFLSRLGLAGATALPELTAWVMKRHVRQLRRERDAAQRPSEAKPAIAEPANK